MALRINFNYQAAASHTALVNTERSMNKSLLRLSTGYRILSAADDAAGLFIADQLALVGSALEQGNRNIQTGISALQIAEGGISQIYDKLKTMYTKAQSAANDINDPNARSALQADIRNLIDAIQKVATDTEYNGIKLLDGTFKNKVIHYGARSEQTISVNISSVKATDLGAYVVFGKGFKTASNAGGLSTATDTFVVTANTEFVKIQGIEVISYGGSGKELIDAATVANNINNNTTLRDLGITASAKNISKARDTFGTITVESTSGSVSDVNLYIKFYVGNKDVEGTPDFTLTYTAAAGGNSVTITLDQIVTDINTEASANGVGITARAEDGKLVLETENGETIGINVFLENAGANNATEVDLSKFVDYNSTVVDQSNPRGYAVKVGELTILGENSYTIEHNGVDDFNFQDVSGNTIAAGSAVSASLFNLYSIDVTDNQGAELAMKVIDVAIKKVDSLRADVGSVMLNLQAIQDYQKVAQDNTNEAENVIRNVDFAKEMIEFTKQQVRLQSSMAMLAQANAIPQMVLQLLR